MRTIGTANVTRGSIAWIKPLRLKIAIFPKRETAEEQTEPATLQTCAIDRDRIFDYVKKHRLPDERARQLRRDARNSVDFTSDLRELQTHSEVTPL